MDSSSDLLLSPYMSGGCNRSESQRVGRDMLDKSETRDVMIF